MHLMKKYKMSTAIIFGFFLSMIILWYTLAQGSHKKSDVLVTIQPPSSVNQFFSPTVLAIALPHPCTVFLWFHSLVFKLF